MAQKEFDGGRLFDLYTRYVGEPESRKDVYGYWTLIVGYLVGFGGILIYLLTPVGGAVQADYFIREVSITLAAIGLPLGLLGIVLLLPVKQRGIQSSVVGTIIALGAVAWFVTVYPNNWGVGTPDYSSAVIAVYFVGVVLVASVAALVPVLTGEKSFFFETEYTRDGEHPAVMIGEATRGGLFAVYNDGARWTWRMLEQAALAGGVDTYLSRLETEEVVERVKEKVRQAGLLEIKHAAFRLYETDVGGFRWKLMRDNGHVVAEGGDEFEDRDGAEESVSLLKEYGPDAPVLDIDGAAFDVYDEAGRWHWRLVDDQRRDVAGSPVAFGSRDDAEAAVGEIQELAPEAGELTIERYGVELYDGEGDWSWRLIDADDDPIAESAIEWSSRREAEDAVLEILDALGDAAVLEAGEPAYEVYREGDAWRWRLLTPSEHVGARSHAPHATVGAARESAGRMAANMATADVVVFDDEPVEIYQATDGWRWRLVTEDRDLLARSARAFADRETVSVATERLREQAAAAELIEFENAAFQLYEAEAGEWRWRLIDEDGNIMAHSGEDYTTRDDAADAMVTLKQHAPDADLLEIETAAWELFEDDAGRWNVRLVDETGQELAEGGRWHETRADARDSIDDLVEWLETAEARVMDRAAFQVYPDTADEWWWRFIHPDGTIISDGVRGHATRDEAATAVETLRDEAAGAGVHVLGALGVELESGEDGWGFRLVDGDREPIAEGLVTYPTREAVEAAVGDVRGHAPDAPVFDIEGAAFRVRQRGGAWEWELLDEERDALARCAGSYETRQQAQTAMRQLARLAPDAGLLDYGTAAFECYRADDGWRWRLIDEDEWVIAESTAGKADREDVEDEIGELKGVVGDASILEIEGAAFELHEDRGDWIWRLIDEDGNELGESVLSYESREEAREAMGTVKEFAPVAMTSVAE